jgi:hypothetical protein
VSTLGVAVDSPCVTVSASADPEKTPMASSGPETKEAEESENGAANLMNQPVSLAPAIRAALMLRMTFCGQDWPYMSFLDTNFGRW